MLASLPRRLLVVLAPVALLACTPTGAPDDDATPVDVDEPSPERTVAIPASRLTPFCRAMLDLDEELETDPPADIAQAIIDTYVDIEQEVPDLLRPDFDVVLAELRGEPVPTAPPTDPATTAETTSSASSAPPSTDETGATLPPGDPLADEGRLPGDTPAERISNYVDAECRGIQNNPGPPATQPLEEPPTSEG